MLDVIDFVSHVDPVQAYAVIATVVLAESVLLVGAFIPTFTILATAGALARAGSLDIVSVVAAAACAVIVGDLLAHRVGRAISRRPWAERLILARVPAAARRGVETRVAKHGPQALLAARFIPLVRTIIPHAIGMAGIPYRRIAPYSAIGAVLWATAYTTVGFFAAAGVGRIATLGPAAITAAIVVVGAAILWRTAARRRRRSPDRALQAIGSTAE